jgi:Rad3-related DNA helicase
MARYRIKGRVKGKPRPAVDCYPELKAQSIDFELLHPDAQNKHICGIIPDRHPAVIAMATIAIGKPIFATGNVEKLYSGNWFVIDQIEMELPPKQGEFEF